MSGELPTPLQTLRDLDPERYLSCLYLPKAIRADVASIWAFNAEVSRIPDLVSEPMPGEIRIQWWRDLIKSGDNVGSGPLAGALMNTISKHNLPRDVFDTYLEARIFDLYNDPMPDEGTFEGYLGETVSSLFQLASFCFETERTSELADACGHAGMTVGISRLLGNCARHRLDKRLYFPETMLEKNYLDAESWFAPGSELRHAGLISDVVSLAQYHLTFSKAVLARVPQHIRPIFLPICFVRPLLNQVIKSPYKCLEEPVLLSPLVRQWTIFRAVIRKIP